MRSKRRCATAVIAALALATAAGCGGDNGGGSGGKPTGGRASPDTEGALLTILNYGRASAASEVCPLLSAAYAKRIGNGDAKKCATLGATSLCPCESTPLEASSVSVEGNTATAKVVRPRTGATVSITLVREGGGWKIDKLDPQKA
jgi:hypothetical protein